MPEYGPIERDFDLFTDTDVPLLIPIVDENGIAITVLAGWQANFEIDVSTAHKKIKLAITATVVKDPPAMVNDVFSVSITDDLIQPGSGLALFKAKKYPYSFKRLNAGAEREMMIGFVNMRQARK